MKKISLFFATILLAISAHAEILQYSPVRISAAAIQSPWVTDIDGNGHSLSNALTISATSQVSGGFIISGSDSDAVGNICAQTDTGQDICMVNDWQGGENGLESVNIGLLVAGNWGFHSIGGDLLYEYASFGQGQGVLLLDPTTPGAYIAGPIYGDPTLNAISIDPISHCLWNDLGCAFSWDGAGLSSNQSASFGSVSATSTLSAGTSLSVGTTLTSYNGVSTAGVGQPYIVAHDSKTNLSGASGTITTTTIYAVPASKGGLYRVSAYANVVSGAGSSSSLGGLSSNLLKVIYTDVTTSASLTAGPVANVSGTNLAANTTAAIYIGSVVVNAKASTNLQYSFDYSTAGGSPMVYNFKIVVERID